MPTSRIKVTTQSTLASNIPCDASVFVGAVVRFDAGVAKNALADTLANSRVVGFCVKKKTSTLCSVVFSGRTEGVFVGLDTTKDYFLSPSTPGSIQVTPPIGSGEFITRVGRPFSSTQMVTIIGTRTQRAV